MATPCWAFWPRRVVFVDALEKANPTGGRPVPYDHAAGLDYLLQVIPAVCKETPPEIIADLMDVGVCLSGGGGLLQGLDRRLSDELKIRVWVAEDPMSCVARGAGAILEDYDHLNHLLTSLERSSNGRHS